MHGEKGNKNRYDSSSSSGKLAVNIQDSQTKGKKVNLAKNNTRYSSLRTTSAHKKATCTTHCLVSARQRSNKLKWKEFDHGCNNMRILESNRKIHESRILSGHHPTNHQSKIRKQIVGQVGLGHVTINETDKKLQDMYTDRSGGKSGRSGGQKDTNRSGGFKDTNRSGGKQYLYTSRSGHKSLDKDSVSDSA